VAPQPAPRKRPVTAREAKPGAEPPANDDAPAKPDGPPEDDPGPSNADLIPWIKIK
jgi:hypothetical protein